MTENAQPNPAPPHGRYVAAETGEWDSGILTTLVREFIRAALRQPAIADFVGEHFFDGDEPPDGVADALRLAIAEVLGATASEDWEQVASTLLTYARECMEHGGAAVAPRPAALAEGWAPPRGFSAREGWAPPLGFLRRPFRRRKPPVRVEPSEILVWLTERGSATTREIAQQFNISESSVWRNADALVHQGKVDVTPGEARLNGRPRVYSVPRPTDSPTDGLQRRSTCPSNRIELDVLSDADDESPRDAW